MKKIEHKLTRALGVIWVVNSLIWLACLLPELERTTCYLHFSCNYFFRFFARQVKKYFFIIDDELKWKKMTREMQIFTFSFNSYAKSCRLLDYFRFFFVRLPQLRSTHTSNKSKPQNDIHRSFDTAAAKFLQFSTLLRDTWISFFAALLSQSTSMTFHRVLISSPTLANKKKLKCWNFFDFHSSIEFIEFANS